MLRNRRKTLFFAQRHPDSGICLLSFCVIMRNYSLPQENHLFAGTWKHVGGKSCKSAARPPLREALKVLVAEGLLRHEPRRGCFVAEITERDLDDLFPVIALLEGRAAHEATRKAGAADIAALDVLHQRL